METIKKENTDRLLESGLEILHQESQQWSSELKLWKLELNFFQKLLDKYSQKFTSPSQKKQMSHFQNMITYYTGELLDNFEDKIRNHEMFLAKELENEQKLNESMYRQKHAEVGSHIGAFRVEFNVYKKEFFNFFETVM